MQPSSRSRISVDVFKPSRPYADIIQGIPIYINRMNPSRGELTERSEVNRPLIEKSDSFPRKTINRMNIREASLRYPDDKDKKPKPEKATKLAVYYERFMNFVISYSIAESLNDISFEGRYDGKSLVSEIIWALFVIDFITNFFWLKRLSDKNLYNKKQIAIHYLETWALIDLVSLIPLRWFGNPNAESVLKLVRISKYERIRKMMKIDNIAKYVIQKLTKSHKRHIRTEFALTGTWDLILYIAIMAHTSYSLACVWWYWSDLMYRYDYAQDNFINLYGLNDRSKNDKAVITVYYIITSVLTIGYGDLHPVNIYEMGFSIIFLMIAVLGFSALMSTAITLISNLSESLKGQKKSWQNVDIFESLKASHGEISQDLNESILNFFDFYAKTDRLGSLAKTYKGQENVKHIIERHDDYFKPIPASLKKKMFDTLFSDYFAFFRRIFSDKYDFKYHICSFLIPRRFLEGDIIIGEGDKSQELYLITSGIVSLNYLNDFGSLNSCKHFSGKYSIGDHCVILNKPSFATFRAEGLVSGLFIPKKPFKIIIKAYFQHHFEYLKMVTKRVSIELINFMGKCGFEKCEEVLHDLNKDDHPADYLKYNSVEKLSLRDLYLSFKK